ncbi:MurR/RpiR family transcriptional regulator [Oscillibacter sp.]|uniref:MurR/RpiR family transcriptional regulator n=1 Tax=Oscillibacter sp. TaxID=1945593 RepID=UPI002D7E8AE5|nr:MurR/RpiR family transcriptional regulator [Oscillibacter sp.]
METPSGAPCSLILKIKHYYPSMSPTQRRIADFILENTTQVVHLNVAALAGACHVSEATVVRFSRILGFPGFRDLKIAFAMEPRKQVQIIHEEITESDSPYQVFGKVCKSVFHSMEDTKSILSSNSEALDKIVEAIRAASRILIIGMGSSSYVAADLHHKLLRLGYGSLTYVDPHLQMISAMNLQKGDLLIAISNSGASKEILDTVALAKSRGVTIASILRYGESPLLHQTDLPLFVASPEAPYHMLPMSSRIVQLSYVDTLYILTAIRDGQASIDQVNAVEDMLKESKLL